MQGPELQEVAIRTGLGLRLLGALVLDIGLINLWTRLNITMRQIADDQTW